MKRIIKRILIIAAVIFALLVIGCGAWIYHTHFKAERLDSLTSPDGEYTLTLFSVGVPDFPFGYANGRITLTKSGRSLSETKIDLANEGRQITRESWTVVWEQDCARVALHASEQPDEQWTFYFNGQTERLQNPPAEQSQSPIAEPSLPDAESSAVSPEPIITDLKMDTLKNGDGELLFDIEADDFINCFNRAYLENHPDTYLTPLSEWTSFSDISPYFEYEADRYLFSAEEQILTMPTLSIYMPRDKSGLYEIMLTFDDHGYEYSMYREFEEMCLCALSAVLPDLDDDKVKSLYADLYEQTDKNFWGDYYANSGSKRPVIETMYRCGSVGLYGYYGAGTASICIIPLTDGIQKQLAKKGVEFEAVH